MQNVNAMYATAVLAAGGLCSNGAAFRIKANGISTAFHPLCNDIHSMQAGKPLMSWFAAHEDKKLGEHDYRNTQ